MGAARTQRTAVAGVGGGLRVFRKHPDEGDKFSIDWTAALGADTISTAVWEADTGITLGLLGGDAIIGKVTTCKIGRAHV